jgi:hypothetical protein
VGDKFERAQILGMDLSPIQPVFVPPNVKFVLDDIEHENGWDLPENHFDYIHLRHTLHSIRDRQKLLKRIYKYVAPLPSSRFLSLEPRPGHSIITW